jgi:acetyl esterase/lipase
LPLAGFPDTAILAAEDHIMSFPDPRTLVDPDLLPLLEAVPTITLSKENLAAVRSQSRLPIPQPDAAAAAVEMTVRRIPGPEGAPEVEVIVYRPPVFDAPAACVLHLHGGGFVMGSAASIEGPHRTVAALLGCVIVTVEYRLAPETIFPGAVEDAYAALTWVFENAAELNVDPTRIGVGGESAGGGLAAALALLARDRGHFPLAFQHLTYPMLDDRTCTTTDPHPHTGDFIWTAESNRFGWSSLLGTDPGGPDVSPYAAPARATDLSGLPPTYIATGGLDLFLEEDLEYARRLMRGGVPVELHVYPGGFHAFDLAPTATVSGQARRDSLTALKRLMSRRPID